MFGGEGLELDVVGVEGFFFISGFTDDGQGDMVDFESIEEVCVEEEFIVAVEVVMADDLSAS